MGIEDRALEVSVPRRLWAPLATASGRQAKTVVTSWRLARILDLLGQVGDPDTRSAGSVTPCAQQLEVSGAAVALILCGNDAGWRRSISILPAPRPATFRSRWDGG